jgi:RNA polymerase sigma-70 factor (ECF subfamily)
MAATRMNDETGDGRPRLRVVPGGRGGTGPAGPRDEAALLGAWLAGDDDAFGELVARHEPLVLALVRRYAASPDDARDLAQRTFLKAFESARRALLRGPATGPGAVPFRRWVVRVALNLARNHRRDARRWTHAPDGLSALDHLGSRAAGADQRLEEEEASRRMRRAVLALPRRQREVLTLRIDADLPFSEIAAALGCTDGAARGSFHLALKKLRDELRDAPATPKEDA